MPTFDSSNNKQMNTQINHSEYSKKVKTMTVTALLYTIRDCRESIKKMPDGIKAGYYADEINYCASELYRRNVTTKK